MEDISKLIILEILAKPDSVLGRTAQRIYVRNYQGLCQAI